MALIQLRLEGNNTDELAQALQQYMTAQWDMDVTVEQATKPKTEGDKDFITAATTVGQGVIGVMAFVITLDKFLKATDSLTERFKAKQRLEQLVEWFEQNRMNPNQVLWLEVDGQLYLVKADQITAMLNAMQE